MATCYGKAQGGCDREEVEANAKRLNWELSKMEMGRPALRLISGTKKGTASKHAEAVR